MGKRSVSAIEWIIYYDDGSSFTSGDGEPHDAPRDGVQVVTRADRKPGGCGKIVWHGNDYYCWQDDEWVGRNLVGLMDYLRQPGHYKVVIQGRCIGYDRFIEIRQRAVDDPRMPFKRGVSPRDAKGPF